MVCRFGVEERTVRDWCYLKWRSQGNADLSRPWLGGGEVLDPDAQDLRRGQSFPFYGGIWGRKSLLRQLE